MKILKKALWQFPSDLNALDRVLSWFGEFYELSIPRKVWLQCELALAEWFTNVVRYAHKDLPSETPIDIAVTLFDECLEIRIWDCGQPFDLEEYFKNLPKTVNLYTEGGRGIPILYQIADQLSYLSASDQRNCLVLVKYY